MILVLDSSLVALAQNNGGSGIGSVAPLPARCVTALEPNY